MDKATAEQIKKLARLLGRLCDEQLDGEELAELDSLLHVHAWARDRYFAQMELHARLIWVCGFSSSDHGGAPGEAHEAPLAGFSLICPGDSDESSASADDAIERRNLIFRLLKSKTGLLNSLHEAC